jgi:8-amino-7-oxononanoate synthase
MTPAMTSPMPQAFARQAAALDDLRQMDRFRQLIPRAGHDFSSNDYLGLSVSEALKEAAVAALERGVAVGAGARGCCGAMTRNISR